MTKKVFRHDDYMHREIYNNTSVLLGVAAINNNLYKVGRKTKLFFIRLLNYIGKKTIASLL